MADKPHTIHVNVVSAETSIFSAEARFVVLLITRVRPGAVRIEKADGGEEFVFIASGIL